MLHRHRHLEMLDLLVLEHLLDVEDGAGGHALGVEKLDQSALVRDAKAFSSSTASALRFLDRSGAVLKRGSSRSGSVPSASQRRRNMFCPEAAILMWPSLVWNTPVGMAVGWSFPAWAGSRPR
jgi:hypothetical protein